MDDTKNKGGRPRKAPEDTLQQRSHRALPAQWAEFDALGGIEWLRAFLDESARKRARKTRVRPPAG